ncbi:MAG: hypothetical protein LC102_06685 [Ignavibacteriales bacterium]|nr:MAG: hypothetical protein F9K26_11825 [Ignavibacteriaceae bacterium]MBW7873994.1 hypothetical protein [Ignavibacteria bacterium]MBZ0198118.1 hypothetical protein [Ignavibacteriaceae bacterium]MCZ2143095.1 hypothetical protein [Ignavibacteriales bacterium]WKZ72575.1 MAG: hypothetical protein QY308_13250 [Ignavibacteriaceae bacterium]
MKKNRKLAIFLIFAAVVQLVVIYTFYKKARLNEEKEFLKKQIELESKTKIETDKKGLKEAEALLKEGKTDLALNKLQEVQGRNPNIAGVAALLGQAYYMKNELSSAEIYLEKAVYLNDKKPTVYLMFGSIKAGKGEKERACAAFEEANALGETSAADSLSKYCR